MFLRKNLAIPYQARRMLRADVYGDALPFTDLKLRRDSSRGRSLQLHRLDQGHESGAASRTC